MDCFKNKEPECISTLQVPPEIDLRYAEKMLAAFNNDFRERLHNHLGVKKDAFSGSKACVTRAAFKEMFKQSCTDLDEQCTPAITGRYGSFFASHFSNLLKYPPIPQNAFETCTDENY